MIYLLSVFEFDIYKPTGVPGQYLGFLVTGEAIEEAVSNFAVFGLHF